MLLVSEWRQWQLGRQARFWQGVRLGASFTAACEAAGVDRRQGYRWRKAARRRIPPPACEVVDRCLSLEERLQIADLRLAGLGVRAIAAELGRAAFTVSRELTRNGVAAAVASRIAARPGSGRRGSRPSAAYVPYRAHTRAQQRARRPKQGKLRGELAGFVEARLVLRWSPQQISAELAALHTDRPEIRVSHETIYQAAVRAGPRLSAR